MCMLCVLCVYVCVRACVCECVYMCGGEAIISLGVLNEEWRAVELLREAVVFLLTAHSVAYYFNNTLLLKAYIE